MQFLSLFSDKTKDKYYKQKSTFNQEDDKEHNPYFLSKNASYSMMNHNNPYIQLHQQLESKLNVQKKATLQHMQYLSKVKRYNSTKNNIGTSIKPDYMQNKGSLCFTELWSLGQQNSYKTSIVKQIKRNYKINEQKKQQQILNEQFFQKNFLCDSKSKNQLIYNNKKQLNKSKLPKILQ